jgi:CMP-N,N'-diacetyllegionaminic acid synthase
MSEIIAVVPARSGSTGLANKNIKLLAGKPLLQYSIEFAKELGISDVICSTDSERYAEIAVSGGARVDGLRKESASLSSSMEEEVIDDINEKFESLGIAKPKLVLWLRPTFVFRSLSMTRAAINDVLLNNYSSSRVVTEVDPRLYYGKEERLLPLAQNSIASMVRRQGLQPLFHVYNSDVFLWPDKTCPIDFLGGEISFHVAEKVCGMDIDTAEDFEMVEALVSGGISPIRT